MSERDEGLDVREAVRSDLAGLALGMLDGRERSEILEHVATCGRCTTELEQVSIVADSMLQLWPEAEPPFGFEQRFVQRMRARDAAHVPRRMHRIIILAAAAMVAVLLGIGIGTLATNSHRDGVAGDAAGALTTAKLTSASQVVGEVFISRGRPAWMFMTIDRDGPAEVVTCRISLTNGKVDTLGTFALSAGYGAWGVPLPALLGQVRSAHVEDADGTVLASASL